MASQDRQCIQLLDNCPACDRFFRRDERYLECPDCGASRRCRAWTIKGSKYCAVHGGKSFLKYKKSSRKGRPIVSGSSSKSIVANLASKYVQMQKSGPLQSNRAVLDALDTRLFELLDRVEQNYSENRIKKIISAWEALKKAIPGMAMWLKDNPNGRKAYQTLDAEVDKAYHDYESWKQIGEFFDLRRKVSVDEMKILKDMQALISAEDAYELAGKLLGAVLQVLGDQPNGSQLINLIHGEFETILGEPHIEKTGRREPEIIDIDTSRMD